jgi:transcriptional regulator with XRE-family HTH domain
MESHAARVAQAVREALKDHSKTQTDLAQHLGVTQQWVSRRLTGDVVFSVEELWRVADWLAVPVTQFLPEVKAAS